MATLAKRLAAVRKHEKELETQDQMQLPLGQNKVLFGSKHRGRTYDSVWKDQAYVQWYILHCQNNKGDEHRLFRKYLSMKIAEEEERFGFQEILSGSTSPTEDYETDCTKEGVPNKPSSSNSQDKNKDKEQDSPKGTTSSAPRASTKNCRLQNLEERIINQEHMSNEIMTETRAVQGRLSQMERLMQELVTHLGANK